MLFALLVVSYELAFSPCLDCFSFFDFQPREIFIDSLDRLGQQLGVYVQVVPEGVELIPPQQTVKQLGKVNRSLREQQDHLNYVFDMMDGADFEEEGLLLATEDAMGSFE